MTGKRTVARTLSGRLSVRTSCDKLKNKNRMSVFRVILSIIFPPLAVCDKGCGSLLIVFILTMCGWVPGVIGALVILNKKE